MDFRPQLYRRRRNQLTGQCDDVEIVVEMLSPARMLGVAKDTRLSFTPAANAASVIAANIGKKDIGTQVLRLRRAFQVPPHHCEPTQVQAVLDGNEHIGVFWQGPRCCDQADERDAQHTLKRLKA